MDLSADSAGANSPSLFGRERDQASVAEFLEAVASSASGLVISGEAGIGKTTLWQCALDGATRLGFQVLVARPAQSEARLSYSGLADLLDPFGDEVLAALPDPQRRALEVALLKVCDDGSPPDPRSVSTAVLAALRTLAARTPVVVAVDDVQWLDHPSARVLHYVVRRLGPAAVGVIVAVRRGQGLVEQLDVAQGVGARRVWRIDVGPLSVAALKQVVHSRLGGGTAHATLVRVHRASGGNPFYALELARALRGRDAELVPGQPLPVPEDMQALVGARLLDLPERARQAVQVVAAVTQPSEALVSAVLGAGGGTDEGMGVAEAVRAGVLLVDGGRLRLAHPLLGSVAYYQCSDGQRRRLHRSIAQAVTDPEERARHLAVAAAGPDAEVAVALDDAVLVAAARGAPDAAAEMCELARRLTPVDDVDEAHRRAVGAAWYHFAAGDLPLARAQLAEIVATSAPGPARADVLRRLGELRYHHDFVEAVELFEQARAEVGDDDRSRAAIEMDLAFAIITTTGDTTVAGAQAEAGVACARRCCDSGLLAAALAVSALVDFVAGLPGAEDKMAQAVALEDPRRPHVLFNHPSFLAGLVWMWTEHQIDARSAFERLHRLALDEGEESALPGLGFFAACLACRMGDLEGAARYAQSSADAAVNVGGDVSRAAALTAQALVAAHLGDAPAARDLATEAASLFQRAASLLPALWPLWALGFVELSLGDPGAAHAVLGPVSDLVVAYGLGEPALAPSIPDDIESLVALGELDAAEALLGWLEERSERLDRAWGRATSGRCRALLLAAQGDLDGAATVIEAAMGQHDRISLPLERGRTLLIKGQIERRRKRKAAAKEAFDESLATFEEAGAALWALRVKDELSRINIRPPAPLDLTATEAKVADLAATGLSTKQVAERAFLSARSVEGVLARVYRKLGVTSRAELANAMTARRGTTPS